MLKPILYFILFLGCGLPLIAQGNDPPHQNPPKTPSNIQRNQQEAICVGKILDNPQQQQIEAINPDPLHENIMDLLGLYLSSPPRRAIIPDQPHERLFYLIENYTETRTDKAMLEELRRLLKDERVNVNHQRQRDPGDTFLITAIRHQKFAPFMELLAHPQINVLQRNRQGHTPLWVLAHQLSKELDDLKRATDAHPPEFYDEHHLILFSAYDFLEKMREAIAKSMSRPDFLESSDALSQQDLIATFTNAQTVLDQMLFMAVDLDDKPVSPDFLHLFPDDIYVSPRRLIGAGANVNALNANGETPLMTLFSRTDGQIKKDMVKELLRHHAAVSLRTPSGKTILETAIDNLLTYWNGESLLGRTVRDDLPLYNKHLNAITLLVRRAEALSDAQRNVIRSFLSLAVGLELNADIPEESSTASRISNLEQLMSLKDSTIL